MKPAGASHAATPGPSSIFSAVLALTPARAAAISLARLELSRLPLVELPPEAFFRPLPPSPQVARRSVASQSTRRPPSGRSAPLPCVPVGCGGSGSLSGSDAACATLGASGRTSAGVDTVSQIWTAGGSGCVDLKSIGSGSVSGSGGCSTVCGSSG